MSPDRTARIGDVLRTGDRSFSFEFFPPKDEEGERVLWRSIADLEELHPTFVSVTYGAGGSTRDRTVAITGRIATQTSLLPMAHLTCVGHTCEEIEAILDDLTAAGVRNVLALRGDPSAGPGTPWVPTEGGVCQASELVSLIRRCADVSVGVAAFPEGHRDAPTLDADAQAMKAKYDAGAEFAITDMVLRAEDYFGLVERARAVGVDFPIIPGIMPVLNVASMHRMVEMSGRLMPPEIEVRIRAVEHDPAAVRAVGVEIATELCDVLLGGGAPGLHFYTLNRSKATREIWEALRLRV